MVSHLYTANLCNSRVLLRADLNITLVNNKIAGDFRLRQLKPTLDLLIAKQARIILATHIGRPNGYQEDLSTKVIADWLEEHGYSVILESDLARAYDQSFTIQPGSILLLENLRFFAGEQTQDNTFAHELARLGDYYVNDAFGLLHRADTSVTLVPQLFKHSCKSIGLLIEKELASFKHIDTAPEQPFVMLIGGGKVKDKLPFIDVLIDKASTILLCPALVFTFSATLGKNVGKSIVEPEVLDHARQIITKAEQRGVVLQFPVDYQVALGDMNGKLEYTNTDNIPDDAVGIAIGPKTVELYVKELKRAKTVFVNGAMGFFDRPETMHALYTLLKTIAQSNAYSVIGGGESVTAVYKQGLEKGITFCSTGGGAALALLTGAPLPGLAYM